MGTSLTSYMKNTALTLDSKKMAAALEEAADDASTGSGAGVLYLNFSGKRGTYALGPDKENIDPTEPYILEPASAFKGWQCWLKNTPEHKIKWSVYHPESEVAEEDLEYHGPYKDNEGWKKVLGVGFISKDGTNIEFSIDSVSGRNALSAVFKEVTARMAAEEPDMPILTMDAEEFTAQGQTNLKPKFTIISWASRENVEAYLSDVGYTFDDLVAGKKVTAAQKKKLAA